MSSARAVSSSSPGPLRGRGGGRNGKPKRVKGWGCPRRHRPLRRHRRWTISLHLGRRGPRACHGERPFKWSRPSIPPGMSSARAVSSSSPGPLRGRGGGRNGKPKRVKGWGCPRRHRPHRLTRSLRRHRHQSDRQAIGAEDLAVPRPRPQSPNTKQVSSCP